MRTIMTLQSDGLDPRSDDVLGEALLRQGILRTGHTPRPIEYYLNEQRQKQASYRSYQTSARGLRELFRILALIECTDGGVTVTPRGRVIASFSGRNLDEHIIEVWRHTIRQVEHDGGDGESSHPYQVLLRLIARRPGITRAKCALALEARNDTDAELDRIASLSDMGEAEIRRQIGVTKTNWDNAKKILPSFAEQLADVRKINQQLYLNDVPGSAVTGTEVGAPQTAGVQRGARRPRSSRKVTARTIGKAGTGTSFDEVEVPIPEETDPTIMAQAIQTRTERLRRHNLIVQRLARILEQEDAELYEDPFDCLACFESIGLLIEVKTLDGSESDERKQVRDALAKLLYYESFVTQPLVNERSVIKIACFEAKPSDAHIEWLADSDICAIWAHEDMLDANEHTKSQLSDYFPFSAS
jgi:hypothetical protein